MDVETRRASGRERSRRYYARTKAMTGRTHPERLAQGYAHPKRARRELTLYCGHGCSCTELTTSVICGFCKVGLCV